MRKQAGGKLVLTTETLVPLQAVALDAVAGGINTVAVATTTLKTINITRLSCACDPTGGR